MKISMFRGQVLECGRICDWKDGIAEKVLAGLLHVSVIVFRIGKKEENLFQSKSINLRPSRIVSSSILKDVESLSSLSSSIVYGSFKTQGNRRYMEDDILTELDMEYLAHRINNSKSQFNRRYPNHMYFAILDGHNGKEAVDFVRDYLHTYIVLSPHFPLNLNEAIRESFHSIDKKILEKSAIDKWESGTTAVSLIVSADRILVAHVGDCRAILSRGGKAIPLTTDHHPNHPEEKQRIERAGGFVRDGRVGDLLSVARALGDYDIETGRKIQGLTCEPDVVDYLLQESDEFVILATDGLWEKFQEQNAVSFTRRSLQRHQDIQRACEELIAEALRRQATDNVAVLIISFHKRKDFSWETCPKDSPAESVPTISGSERRVSKVGVEVKSRPRFCFKGLQILQDALHEAKAK